MIRRTHIIAIAAAALMGAFASQAQAANVGLSDDGILTYAAAPGEVNNAQVTRVGATFRVGDLGAPLSASGNCVQTGADVTCPAAGVRRIQAFTGDRDDQFRLLMAAAPATLVDGGPGDDFVSGSQSADIVFGGVGRDTIIARGGADQLFGGADSDLIAGEDGGDRIDGGAGQDSLRGGPGDDNVDGGADADRIVGDGGANTLVGGAGGDVLDGSAPQSQDRFVAGTGNDVVISRDGRFEPVSCGGGVDRARANLGDSVANDCEQISLF